VLTRRGRAALVLSVALLVAGRILGVTELFGVAATAAAAVALGAAMVRSPRLRVALSATVAPPVISIGDRASLEIVIENSGSVPTPGGRLQLVPAGGGDGPLVEVPRIVPGERATVSLRLPTDRRGRHEVTGFDAVLADPLGIARRRVTGLGATRFGVRPVAEPLSGVLPIGGGGADLETTRSSAERLRTGASLLRPYVAGDDLRRVHWPTTARIGDLMVREGGDRERDATSGITVVLSARVTAGTAGGSAVDRFEHAVHVTASILTAAAREGSSFRLVIPGSADSGDGSGERHLDLAFDLLTDVRGLPASHSGESHSPIVSRSALEGRVVIMVAACDDPEAFGTLVGTEPAALVTPGTPLVLVCAGALESSIEAGHRHGLVVRTAIGESLEELWTLGDAAVVAR